MGTLALPPIGTLHQCLAQDSGVSFAARPERPSRWRSRAISSPRSRRLKSWMRSALASPTRSATSPPWWRRGQRIRLAAQLGSNLGVLCSGRRPTIGLRARRANEQLLAARYALQSRNEAAEQLSSTTKKRLMPPRIISLILGRAPVCMGQKSSRAARLLNFCATRNRSPANACANTDAAPRAESGDRASPPVPRGGFPSSRRELPAALVRRCTAPAKTISRGNLTVRFSVESPCSQFTGVSGSERARWSPRMFHCLRSSPPSNRAKSTIKPFGPSVDWRHVVESMIPIGRTPRSRRPPGQGFFDPFNFMPRFPKARCFVTSHRLGRDVVLSQGECLRRVRPRFVEPTELCLEPRDDPQLGSRLPPRGHRVGCIGRMDEGVSEPVPPVARASPTTGAVPDRLVAGGR